MSLPRRARARAVNWKRLRPNLFRGTRYWWAVGLAWLVVPGIALIVTGVRSIELVPPLDQAAAPVAPDAQATGLVVRTAGNGSTRDTRKSGRRSTAKPAPAKPAKVVARKPQPVLVVQSASPPPTPASETNAPQAKQDEPAEPADDGRPAGHETEYDDRSVTRQPDGARAERAHAEEADDADRHAAQQETLEPPSGRDEVHG